MLTLHSPPDRVLPMDGGRHDTAHGSGPPIIHRPQIEVADVVRQHGEAFLERYGHTLCGEQYRALRAIELCYTAALGGHKTRCDACGHEGCAYNPCRNRHCPKCQGVTRAAWLANRQREVLDTAYVHSIFTLPQDLSPLVLTNPRQLYGLLFRTVSQTLLDIARDPKHLGAELGGLAVLHTWGGQLQAHPHLHCVLPAGGLSPDSSRWVPCRPNFFLPVRVLSRRFRRLYIDGLKHLYRQGELTLTGRCRELAEPRPWARLLAALREKEWVVYAKEPQDSKHILKYLARYTHRVAISNHRLIAFQEGQVTFRFKDHKRGGQMRTQTLKAVEFLRRFCLHILPKGLHKIRYFGYLANCHRQQKLALCRRLLGQSADALVTTAMAVGAGTPESDRKVVRIEPGDVCLVCNQGRMQLVETYHRHRAAGDLSITVPVLDTS
ncbi:MAG: IS91 family transposase [Candidatus Tectomicrobia bacterium]|nr:IS91 family transposase [Candidatus Tectomicrobia bacterium]